MRFRSEINVDQLDSSALVNVIEDGMRHIEECQKNHEILDRSSRIFDEANGIFYEMARLERIMEADRKQIQVALRRLITINPEHPLTRKYRAEKLSEQASGWRACLKKMFSFE